MASQTSVTNAVTATKVKPRAPLTPSPQEIDLALSRMAQLQRTASEQDRYTPSPQMIGVALARLSSPSDALRQVSYQRSGRFLSNPTEYDDTLLRTAHIAILKGIARYNADLTKKVNALTKDEATRVRLTAMGMSRLHEFLRARLGDSLADVIEQHVRAGGSDFGDYLSYSQGEYAIAARTDIEKTINEQFSSLLKDTIETFVAESLSVPTPSQSEAKVTDSFSQLVPKVKVAAMFAKPKVVLNEYLADRLAQIRAARPMGRALEPVKVVEDADQLGLGFLRLYYERLINQMPNKNVIVSAVSEALGTVYDTTVEQLAAAMALETHRRFAPKEMSTGYLYGPDPLFHQTRKDFLARLGQKDVLDILVSGAVNFIGSGPDVVRRNIETVKKSIANFERLFLHDRDRRLNELTMNVASLNESIVSWDKPEKGQTKHSIDDIATIVAKAGYRDQYDEALKTFIRAWSLSGRNKNVSEDTLRHLFNQLLISAIGNKGKFKAEETLDDHLKEVFANDFNPDVIMSAMMSDRWADYTRPPSMYSLLDGAVRLRRAQAQAEKKNPGLKAYDPWSDLQYGKSEVSKKAKELYGGYRPFLLPSEAKAEEKKQQKLIQPSAGGAPSQPPAPANQTPPAPADQAPIAGQPTSADKAATTGQAAAAAGAAAVGSSPVNVDTILPDYKPYTEEERKANERQTMLLLEEAKRRDAEMQKARARAVRKITQPTEAWTRVKRLFTVGSGVYFDVKQKSGMNLQKDDKYDVYLVTPDGEILVEDESFKSFISDQVRKGNVRRVSVVRVGGSLTQGGSFVEFDERDDQQREMAYRIANDSISAAIQRKTLPEYYKSRNYSIGDTPVERLISHRDARGDLVKQYLGNISGKTYMHRNPEAEQVIDSMLKGGQAVSPAAAPASQGAQQQAGQQPSTVSSLTQSAEEIMAGKVKPQNGLSGGQSPFDSLIGKPNAQTLGVVENNKNDFPFLLNQSIRRDVPSPATVAKWQSQKAVSSQRADMQFRHNLYAANLANERAQAYNYYWGQVRPQYFGGGPPVPQFSSPYISNIRGSKRTIYGVLGRQV